MYHLCRLYPMFDSNLTYQLMRLMCHLYHLCLKLLKSEMNRLFLKLLRMFLKYH